MLTLVIQDFEGHFSGKLHDTVVQQGDPYFQAVSHAGPIYFDQKIVWQKAIKVERCGFSHGRLFQMFHSEGRSIRRQAAGNPVKFVQMKKRVTPRHHDCLNQALVLTQVIAMHGFRHPLTGMIGDSRQYVTCHFSNTFRNPGNKIPMFGPPVMMVATEKDLITAVAGQGHRDPLARHL